MAEPLPEPLYLDATRVDLDPERDLWIWRGLLALARTAGWFEDKGRCVLWRDGRGVDLLETALGTPAVFRESPAADAPVGYQHAGTLVDGRGVTIAVFVPDHVVPVSATYTVEDTFGALEQANLHDLTDPFAHLPLTADNALELFAHLGPLYAAPGWPRRYFQTEGGRVRAMDGNDQEIIPGDEIDPATMRPVAHLRHRPAPRTGPRS